ncbi:MAG: acyl-CoA dehydrogenase [Chloroflexi bacterium]|nr:acyl-CoA dehydrogenase [Chloroflexota bacterium]
MLDFTPTEEQQMLVDAIKRYATNDLQPNAHKMDENSEVPEAIIQKGWEIGLIPASIPEELGGFGEYSAITNVLALEELAYGDLASTLKLMAPSLFAYPILFNGTDDQRARFLPLLAEEKPYPATAALNEPGISFDPFAQQTTVAREDDCFVLNGVKANVPNAEGAEWLLVYASDSETGQVGGYLVQNNAEGLEITRREKMMGIQGLAAYQVQLSNVRVGADLALNGGDPIDFQRLIDHMNIGVAAVGTGVMRASYEYAIEYAKDRVQFGQPIATKQAIAFMLAECAIEVDSTRLLAWEAAWHIDEGKPAAEITKAAYLAREYANKASLQVTDSGVQVLGGHGFIREHPVERYLRNARGLPVFTGLTMA